MQRQKIIDEVVNRKRMEGLNTSNKPGMLYKHNIKIQPSEKNY